MREAATVVVGETVVVGTTLVDVVVVVSGAFLSFGATAILLRSLVRAPTIATSQHLEYAVNGEVRAISERPLDSDVTLLRSKLIILSTGTLRVSASSAFSLFSESLSEFRFSTQESLKDSELSTSSHDATRTLVPD